MLWTIFAILIILWLLGWGFHVSGSLIHLLLVIALVVAVINLITGRRTVVLVLKILNRRRLPGEPAGHFFCKLLITRRMKFASILRRFALALA